MNAPVVYSTFQLGGVTHVKMESETVDVSFTPPDEATELLTLIGQGGPMASATIASLWDIDLQSSLAPQDAVTSERKEIDEKTLEIVETAQLFSPATEAWLKRRLDIEELPMKMESSVRGGLSAPEKNTILPKGVTAPPPAGNYPAMDRLFTLSPSVTDAIISVPRFMRGEVIARHVCPNYLECANSDFRTGGCGTVHPDEWVRKSGLKSCGIRGCKRGWTCERLHEPVKAALKSGGDQTSPPTVHSSPNHALVDGHPSRDRQTWKGGRGKGRGRGRGGRGPASSGGSGNIHPDSRGADVSDN
jgi:hypothetical protein